MSSHIRTFVAVELPQSVRRSLTGAVQRISRASNEFRWVEPNNLHITLNFLGDVPNTQTPEVCRAVEQAGKSFQPFGLQVQDVGAFPSNHRPRVVWAGITDEQDDLQRIHRDLTRRFLDLGFPKDRNKFHPHVTLGRQRKNAGSSTSTVENWIAESGEQDFGSCWIDEIVVFSSFLDRGGPTYTPMARIKLQ